MPIYLVQRTDPIDYEELEHAIVRAASSDRVREILTQASEGVSHPTGLYPPFVEYGVKADGSNLTITRISEDGEEMVIGGSINFV